MGANCCTSGDDSATKVQSESTAAAIAEEADAEDKANAIASWPLRADALRVFDLADKDHNGAIDMKELTNVRNNAEMAKTMMDQADINHNGTLDRSEWLLYMKKIFDKDTDKASALLKMYEQTILESKAASWSLRSEAIRVFDLADKDHNGALDMKELVQVRNNPQVAKAMMEKADIDHNGTLEKDEWLVYIKNIYDYDIEKATLALRLYEDQILTNKGSNWALRARAMAVFDLADKDHNGALDMSELIAVRNNPQVAKDMMEQADIDHNGTLEQDEWISYIKSIYDKDANKADLCLKLYEEQMLTNKGVNWPLRAEALRVFEMADKDHNGALDMRELAVVRETDAKAKSMMDELDLDHNGKLDQDEWLTHIKNVADKSEKSAAALLKLYEAAITKSKTAKAG
jgi:Ca2+-binding EF-hand superfamily protein